MSLFKKILIANRGEIACRVARTAKKLGIRTVGVFSEQDKFAKHTQVMDEAYHIGPPQPSLSYLKAQKILEVAQNTGSQAIHPGYGFLSENAEFVNLLEQNKIEFIGPPASAIRAMGSKSESKAIMDNANVPIVPGYHGDEQDPQFLLEEARKIQFPVMLKASLGGGGKGMRIVREEKEFFSQLEAAKREGLKSFNDDHMLIEKYIEKPRHIEVQVFGDKHGNYVHLNERDCSVQRRHQKVIEEAPSKISTKLRQEIGQAAVMAAKAVGYWNAGTVEFIFDTETDKFYFMEMNTRLQVEHPVTELVTGQDLVDWQLRVASGLELPIKDQKHIPLFGHSMEARIYAEDPENGFLPGSGLIKVLREPTRIEDKVRVDTGVREGDQISTFYDPMISKLIVAADDREKCVQALYNALSDYKVVGLPTNIKFLKRVLLNREFETGEFDTSFIAKHEEELLGQLKTQQGNEWKVRAQVALANVFIKSVQQNAANRRLLNPWSTLDGFRINSTKSRSITLAEEDETHKVSIEYLAHNKFNVSREDEEGTKHMIFEGAELSLNPEQSEQIILRTADQQIKIPYLIGKDGSVNCLDDEGAPLKTNYQEEQAVGGDADGEGAKMEVVKSPMPGTIVKAFCEVGQVVKKDEPLISVESMKMEFLIKATHDVKIKEIRYKSGDFVQKGEKLIIFEDEQ